MAADQEVKVLHQPVSLSTKRVVKVNSQCQTNMKGVYAIGDVTDLSEMLAHVASFQSEMVAEIIAEEPVYDPVAVPAIVFTEQLFLLDYLDEAKEAGHPVITVNSLLQQMVISNKTERLEVCPGYGSRRRPRILELRL